MTTTADPRPLDSRMRTLGIRTMLDEAHEALPPSELAELLLAVRRTLRDRAAMAGDQAADLSVLRPGVSQATRVYLRPIELLLHATTSSAAPLGDEERGALERYLEEVAARPRGAAAVPAA
jgi:hypothetical protein